jgi:hypothetical protein
LAGDVRCLSLNDWDSYPELDHLTPTLSEHSVGEIKPHDLACAHGFQQEVKVAPSADAHFEHRLTRPQIQPLDELAALSRLPGPDKQRGQGQLPVVAASNPIVGLLPACVFPV